VKHVAVKLLPTPHKELDPTKTYKVCCECHILREEDELSLDLDTGLGICMTCIGPYKA